MTDDPHAGERPAWAVLYDADCGLCEWLLSGLLRWDRATCLHPIALQRPEADDLLRQIRPILVPGWLVEPLVYVL